MWLLELILFPIAWFAPVAVVFLLGFLRYRVERDHAFAVRLFDFLFTAVIIALIAFVTWLAYAPSPY